MISAQNHPQRSSGSKYLFLSIVFIFTWFGCSQKIRTTTVQTKPQTAKIYKADSTRSDMPVVKKPDTIVWTDVSEKYVPIRQPVKKSPVIRKQPVNPEAGFKDTYSVKLYIPLNSSQYSANSLVDNRFVQFYTGMLLALEDLENEGGSFRINVEDTGENNFDIKKSWSSANEEDIDLIIGPFEREDLKYIATEAARKNVVVVSPWQTSTKIAAQNPYYIQLKPNLKEHFKRMVEHACLNFGPGQVMVVTHAGQEGISWYNFMNEVCTGQFGTTEKLRHYTVHKDSLIAPNTAFVNVFRNNPPQAVILPYYSFNDEQKLYEVVRRLIVDKGLHKVTLYAMPLFLESDKIDFEFYSSFHTRIAISDFVDEQNYKVRQFKRKYYELFGELCGPDALKGYDVMMFVGKNLAEHGTNFQQAITGNKQVYLQTQIDLHETKGESDTNTDSAGFDFYENKHISIIEFRNSGFEIID